MTRIRDLPGTTHGHGGDQTVWFGAGIDEVGLDMARLIWALKRTNSS